MDDNHPLILPVFYLGNIQYWSKLVHQKYIIFNDIENYPKGSFRNRCYIVSSQGLLRLSIPLVGGKHAGQKYTEVKIDQQENWQKKHWQSIGTCYGSAPFFHHYAEKLRTMLEPFRDPEQGCLVEIDYHNGQAACVAQLSSDWKVRPEEDLLIEMQGWLGEGKAKWVFG